MQQDSWEELCICPGPPSFSVTPVSTQVACDVCVAQSCLLPTTLGAADGMSVLPLTQPSDLGAPGTLYSTHWGTPPGPAAAYLPTSALTPLESSHLKAARRKLPVLPTAHLSAASLQQSGLRRAHSPAWKAAPCPPSPAL